MQTSGSHPHPIGTWIHPPPRTVCNHDTPHICNHDVVYCRLCDKVYCIRCGEEWTKASQWTYTWNVGGHNYDAESESS
jgi:hypothetical protein